jgi:hypothetical protein
MRLGSQALGRRRTSAETIPGEKADGPLSNANVANGSPDMLGLGYQRSVGGLFHFYFGLPPEGPPSHQGPCIELLCSEGCQWVQAKHISPL